MDAKQWLGKAAEELTSLTLTADATPDDEWRSAVLIGRLVESPQGPTPPGEMLQRLPQLLERLTWPDPATLLATLRRELDADDDAAGALQDALVDIGDVITVGALADSRPLVGALAERSAALAELFPERLLSLHEYAAMRLETVRPQTPGARLWEAVLRAPAYLLAAALPEGDARHSPDATSLVSNVVTIPRRERLQLPREVFQAAAATATRSIQVRGAVVSAAITEEDGQQQLEVWHVSPSVRATLLALRRADGVQLARRELRLVVTGRTGMAELGPTTGRENVLHALVLETGLPAEQLELELLVTDG